MKQQQSDKELKHSWISLLIIIISCCVWAYHMLCTVYLMQDPMQHQIISLGMMILILFLSLIVEESSIAKKSVSIILTIGGLVSTIYLRVNYEALQESLGFPEIPDMLIGAVLIFVVLIGTWRTWGLIFPLLAVTLIVYFFFGHHLPKPLYHSKISIDLAMSYLVVGFTGIFGPLLSVMANFGIILLVFGALLEVGGANRFFLEVGKIAGRRLSGGPGQTAVVGSSLVGMVSGGAVGNVIITGSFTIPMMKKVGFSPERAGAIEATASTGSQLMPPIMGIAAFLMAGFLGKDFSEIMIAGVIPSLLFYISVAWGVQLIAKQEGIVSQKQEADKRVIAERAPIFILPLAILVFMLVKGFSAGMSGFCVVLIVIILMFIRKSTRPTILKLFEGIHKGVVMASKITLAVCAVGIISQVFITTGLAQKLASFMAAISFGIPALTLVLTMILALILGLGLPAAAAYSLVAILVTPGIIQMGVEPLRAHFFAFYFAIISAVTPPVALGSMAASSIAESNFMRTGIEAFKLSIPNFIIPFLIVYNPVFLLGQKTTFILGGLSLISAVFAMFMLGAVIYNYLFKPLTNIERMMLLASSLSCFIFCFTQRVWVFALGMCICIIVILLHLNNRKMAKYLIVGK
jgi:TRAP transporter 4TM/12TM fusion protein